MNTHVYVIAEAGVNHNGSIDQAFRLVDAALQAGADAVKFQSFSADRLVREKTALVPYQVGSAADHYQLLKGLELSEESQERIASYCRSAGIEFMSTPYSVYDARFLVSLGVSKIKVASADIVDLQLHEYLSETNMVVIASTGMAATSEVERLVAYYQSRGALSNLWLLQCVSNYPAKTENQNLLVLNSYRELVKERIGFSDHTSNNVCSIAAVALGARMIEKHLTLDKTLPGPDHAASLEPRDFELFVSDLRQASAALGQATKNPVEEELDMRNISRKGLYAAKDIDKGQFIHADQLEHLRPGLGQDSWELLHKLPFKAGRNYVKGDLLEAADGHEK